ncbi:hypothetical protein LPB03_15700 [Polaribacter vadi]|uniref:Uracil-DNA glycosylase-like domain-containing protein n=1 Tax=Polaribacter vadi TaxID=1774273 RepID=A0A1B8TQS5_9FLAO|nr:hypothetical protein [Polaribacter vadi]AOW18807.1 hypothetical protein LPB03_15700 [Polaribacter vadi]OBY61828.1 hypothetical protein LPB3_13600 [Polaribacter vadi]
MNIQKTNLSLLELYKNKYSKLADLLTEKNKSLEHSDKATNPLLLKIDEKYANADFKIMIFGQETNYWYSEENKGEFHGKVEPIFNLYEDFFLSNDCYSYGGQFWNGISRFVELAEQEIDGKVGLVWNNVIKVGKCGKGAPFASIQEIQFEHFNVIQKEIEILKPDLLVFFSGPNYDGHIKKSFKKLGRKSINGFSERQLCEMELSNLAPAFRTYHPNYLWRNDINKFLEPIIEKIKTLHNNV